MYLKSLTMRGFKSFADKTMLELEPGVTAIVGPNGSGKSNVVDAVAWVLGAQGARALRGSKMDDVIFAGTASRPALGRAEVQLLIDNADGRLPIEFSEVTISRTLFRSGESEYALNGAPCRLLDIQELLSDSGIGRQQHVIVGQGQLDSVLSSQPTDRRMIIEEAAGILKYRRRKEKAERRLESTEGNVIRLTDMVREVRRSLAPLARQADSARRSGDLAAELRAIRIYLLGRDLDSLRQRLERIRDGRTAATEQERAQRAELGRLDAEVLVAEHELGGTDADEVNALRRTVEAMRERRRGLAAVLAERQRSLESQVEALADEDVYESLVADALNVRAALGQVDEDASASAVAIASLEEARQQVALAVSAHQDAQTEDERARAIADERQRNEQAIANAEALLERCEGELQRWGARVETLEASCETAATEHVDLHAQLARFEAAQPQLDGVAREAVVRREQSERERLASEAARVAAERDRSHWSARAEALSAALDLTRSESSAQAMAGHAGVAGLVADLVQIEPGFEVAVSAALGQVLGAVAVEAAAVDHELLRVFEVADAHAVILALDKEGAAQASLLPSGVTPLRDVVRVEDARMAVSLDRLLARTVLCRGTLADALAVARANPELIVVTERGDRIGGSVWQIGAAQPGVTRAACDEANAAAASACMELEAAIQRLAAAVEAVDRARNEEMAAASARRSNEEQIGALRREADRSEAERHRLQSELEVATTALAGLQADRDQAAAAAAGANSALGALAMAPPIENTGLLRQQTEQALMAARAVQAEMELTAERRAVEINERRRGLQTRLEEIESRLDRHPREQAQMSARRERMAEEIAAAAASQRRLEQARIDIDAMWETVMQRSAAVDAKRGGARSALDALRSQRVEREQGLAQIRQTLTQFDIDEAETKVRLEQATATCREQYDVETEVAMQADAPGIGDGVSYTARARELERELRILGPVNPLAVEEYDAASERHAFLTQQLDDVKDARKELHRIIKTVDHEIVSLFEAAFTDVAKHFEQLFVTLFPGGSGSLVLTEPNDLLNTGIEIEARPSGKNVRRLTLLSGGERSLTAMAYLFAVFRSRPSPFYLLDEVEAALDDVNLQRFLDLVAAFRDEAQLLIVTHQKRTMDTADAVYGISMPPGGSTKAVSQRLREAKT